MEIGTPRIADPFGTAMLDHLDGSGSGVHVVERDDGYIDTISCAPYFSTIDGWGAPEAEAIGTIQGRVLDVGAGAGRVALHLQEAGLDVTALDTSEGAIAVCRRRGVRSTWGGTVTDLAASSPEPFDTFVFFGNNLGLLGSPAAAAGWFHTLRRLARPGATVVGSLLDPYLTTDPAHLAYHEHNRRRGRPSGQVTVRVRYRDETTPWFDLLWLAHDELCSLVAPLGWDPVAHRQDGAFQVITLAMR